MSQQILDWFGRSAELDFMHTDESKKTISWEEDLDHFSDFLLKGKEIEGAKDCSVILKSIFSVMGLDGSVKAVSTLQADIKTLPLPYDLLNCDPNPMKSVDVFLGGSIHQASKLCYFSEKDAKVIREEEIKIQQHNADLATILKSLLSMELADRKIGETHPGYSRFAGRYKQHSFQGIDSSFLALGLEERLLLTITKAIRFPQHITSSEAEEFERPLEQIKDLFMRYETRFPVGLTGCRMTANKIRDIMLEFIEENQQEPEEEQPQQPQPSQEKGQDEQEGDSNKNQSDKQKQDETPSDSEQGKDGDSEQKKPDTQGDPDRSDSDSSECSLQKGDDESIGKENDAEAKEKSNDAASNGEGEKSESNQPSTAEPVPFDRTQAEENLARLFYSSGLLESVQETNHSTDETIAEAFIVAYNPPPETPDVDLTDERCPVVYKPAPRSSRSRKLAFQDLVSRMNMSKAGAVRSLLKRKSRHNVYNMYGMKSGRFDTNKLVEARLGDPNVYIRQGEANTNRITVVLLVDESGSMGGYAKSSLPFSQRPTKAMNAKQAAIFIAACLQGLPDVDLFIYGHTADTGFVNNELSTNVIVYKESEKFDISTLMDISPRSNNRDGVALESVARRVRKKTTNQGLIFVISDGDPHATDYSGSKAIAHTRNAVINCEQMGFQVTQVAIDSVNSSKMFTNFVDMVSIEDFPIALLSFLGQMLNRVIKVKVT